MIAGEAVRERISTFLRLAPGKAVDSAVLTDLVAESFVLVQLVIDLQEEFGVRLSGEDLRDVRTVGDLILAVTSRG
jgi:acyl carrier protein